MSAHVLSNRGKLVLVQTLRILLETGLYQELGFPAIHGYASKFFGYERSETHAAIQVARALDALPLCLGAFSAGSINWSQLKQITTIATGETEEEWLAFASKAATVQALKAEVKDAREKKRDLPRHDRYGLPRQERKFVFRFSDSDYEKVRRMLARVGEDLAPALAEGKPSPEQILLYLSERLGEPGPEDLERVSDGKRARYALVYQACPRCQKSAVHTPDGLIEVDRDELARATGEATVVSIGEDTPDTIDRPTPPALREAVLLRDGERCTNPSCTNLADDCHHIVFRSAGGKTTAANLTSVCKRCHAVLHSGFIAVSGLAGESLEWTTRADSSERPLADMKLRAESLPVFRIESARADSPPSDRLEYLSSGLTNMGFTKQEAMERMHGAMEMLGEGEHQEGVILGAALRYRGGGVGGADHPKSGSSIECTDMES